MTQNGEDPGGTPDGGETPDGPAEPTIADLQARIDEISGQYAKLKDDFIRMRRKSADSPKDEPKDKPRDAGLSAEDLDARIEYRLAHASLSDDEAKREVEQMLEEAGPRAAVRLARALASDETSDKKRKPARTGTAAQPPAVRQWSPAEVLRLPPDERKTVLDRIRRGEDSFAER